MKSKEKEEKEQLNNRINELMNQRDDWRHQYFESNKRANNLETENQRLSRLNEMLTQAICCVYHNGNAILYDEHDPRVIKIVKDGRVIDTEKAESVRFCWDANEFPRLEVTTL